MSQSRAKAVVITDSTGLRGTIDPTSQPLDGSKEQVLARFEDGLQVLVPFDELIWEKDGSYSLPFSVEELEPQTDAGSHSREEETIVMPVVAEKLDVQKRKVEAGGVRIKKVVHEREEVVDEPLIREEVQVKRVPINRVVEGPVPVRHVGDTMIISLLEEVLVVEKRLMLKEELHITKEKVETYKPQRVVLRTEEAQIERVDDTSQQGSEEDQ